jgi:hypothetical protein
VKSDVRKPLQYAAIVGILLAYRLGVWIYGRAHRSGATRVARPEPSTAETA